VARYVIGLDQSTSSTTAVLLNLDGAVVASSTLRINRYFPQPGWVEQDATELWLTTIGTLRGVIQDARISPEDVEAIGIANQRETLVVWEIESGEPVGRAIGWQDRRTRMLVDSIPAEERAALEHETGMLAITNAAGPKLDWLLKNDRRVQRGIANGTMVCGTVDSWIIWKLSGGLVHATDHSNASVTALHDARSLTWSARALARFGIPYSALPELKDSTGPFGVTSRELMGGAEIPIAACVGDQQSATFAQACTKQGMAKTTYGSGTFTLLNVGDKYIPPGHGAFAPVLWSIDGSVEHGLEYMTDDAGGVLDWLRDGLGIIDEAREAESLARQVPDAGGLYFVPTLGAPAAPIGSTGRLGGGLLVGLSHSSTRQHIARAALEAIAFQTRDALEAMVATCDLAPAVLRADGAGARNDFLLQFQADICGIPVERPQNLRTTPTGAAYLAGISVGFWDSVEETNSLWRLDRRFEPMLSDRQREERYAGWREALSYTSGLSST
jgi:glycerol kinase